MRRLAFALTAVILLCAGSAVPAGAAQPQNGSISGQVVDASNGLPLSDAQVDLQSGEHVVAQTITHADGTFRFQSEPAGLYTVTISRSGYQPARISGVVVIAGQTAYANTSLNAGSVRTIASVAVGGRSSLQTSTTINQYIAPQILQQQNYIRAADALTGIAGVTPQTSASVGDDEFISIRGYNPSETATLLDGHRIGPLGSAVNAFHTFDSQISPFYGLSGIQVIYGSGASGLFGVDAIGGSVNYQTSNPTTKPSFTIEQGIGNDGKLLTGLQATGTFGKLGYAVMHAVQGTYGSFIPQVIPQTGLLGNDISAANLAANTYVVAGDYTLRNDLLKLSYAFSPSTQLTVTGWAANVWEDKSGNGDNDYVTYPFQLYNAQQALSSNGNTTSVTLGNGQSVTCTGAIAIINDSPAGYGCLSPQQYAQDTSGPAGGGPGTFQGIRNQDYDARLTQRLGANNEVTIDGYVDNYVTDFNRFIDSSFFRTNFFLTHGFLIADHISGARNDFGFGFSSERQDVRYDQYPDIYSQPGKSLPQIGWAPPYTMSDNGIFANDEYFLNKRLSFFANLWLKRANVTPVTSLDPRLSVVYRPTDADVLRLTGGHSVSVPQPALVFAPPTVNGNIGSVFPNCSGNLQTTIGDVADRNLQPEKATDMELAYGHRFAGDDTIQINLYDSYEQGAYFEGTLPFTAVGQTVAPSIIQLYLNRISQLCANIPNPTVANLNVNTTYNAAAGRYRGIELSGRVRIARHLMTDYMYDVQSAAYLGVPDDILQQNLTTINGAQIFGIPLHKASIGLEYQNDAGVDIRFDGYHIDGNNNYNRPAYDYANLALGKTWGPITLNLGINNLFNSIATNYGLIGLGVYQPENQFGTDTSPLQQGSELYGMPYRQAMLTVQYRM